MMKKTFLLFSLCLTFTACSSLRVGDLLFHVVEEANAITVVTPDAIDHVAIYAGNGIVIEAIPNEGVTTTPLDRVLLREDGNYVWGRVRGADTRRSVELARKYIGLPYDSLFLPTSDAIYCSELVQLAFVGREGKRLFAPIPMSFHDATGRITDYWTSFYRQRGMDVPEGQPGTNPAELSKRVIVKMKGTVKPGRSRGQQLSARGRGAGQ